MKILLLLFSILIVVGCHSGWEEDPLQDQSDKIKGALKPGTEKPPLPPLKDVVFIDADDFYEFEIGAERSIKFSYRVTHPDLKAIEMDSPGIDSFLPGATYDKVTNTLLWTPGADFVSETEYLRWVTFPLVVFVDNDGVVEEHRRNVAIVVLRDNFAAPKILTVGIPKKVAEEEFKIFEVVVQDFHSSKQKPPILSILSTAVGFKDGTGLVSAYKLDPKQDPNDPALWIFQMSVDLRDKEVTKNSVNVKFGLQVLSGAGVPSAPEKLQFSVVSKAAEPQFYVEQSTDFILNENNSYSFTIIDPKSEGKISVDWKPSCASIAADAICNCRQNNSSATCTINWKPTATGTTRFKIKATNKVSLFPKPLKATADKQFNIRVISGGVQ